VCVCVCARECVCVCVCVCACIYIYIYIYIETPLKMGKIANVYIFYIYMLIKKVCRGRSTEVKGECERYVSSNFLCYC
jgi:hypothetical protein